jgi:hypothetical protein
MLPHGFVKPGVISLSLAIGQTLRRSGISMSFYDKDMSPFFLGEHILNPGIAVRIE